MLSAIKNFAREEFELKHRYAMVPHTDEPHPYVHLVVKVMGDAARVESGIRAIPTWAGAWRRCGAPRGSIGQGKRRSHARVTPQSSVVIGVWASVRLRTFLSSRHDLRGNCDAAIVGKSDAFHK